MTRRIAAAIPGWWFAVSTIFLAVPTARAATLEHEITFSADRVSVHERGGHHEIDSPGALRTYEPGRPDLPWLGELVELPEGMRVQSIEVVSIGTSPLAASVRLPSAAKVAPGLGPIDRTAPDPTWFDRAGFQPEMPVRLGYQGHQRGRNLAALQICPVRWDARSGRLERVSRLRVRLMIVPGGERPLVRERVVPEWEESQPLATRLGGRTAGFAAARPGAEQPLAQQPADFQPTALPSLLGSAVSYVIITDDAMKSEFQRLADWKTQKGFPAVVRTIANIRQEYPYGADDADRIRQFIRDAYQRWGAQWVLLGGDVHIVPTRYARTLFYGGENIPADMYFSCLDGNWNADGDSIYGEGYLAEAPGDSCDLFPDVWVGRATVSDSAEAALFVNKTFQYEKTPVGDYENTVLFFAEVLFPQVWHPGDFVSLDGAQLVEEVLPPLRNHPGVRYTRLYENYTDPRWEPGSYPENKQTVIDSLNRGYNIAVHVGHGYRNVMAVGNDENLDNGNAMALSNSPRVFNLYSINCTSNAIDFPCIGEAFMLAPNGGSVTNIGSTRLDFPSAGRAYQREFFRLVYEDSVTAVGEAQARQKLPFIGYSSSDNVNRWTQFTLLLLGDPELRLYTALPRQLAVTHPGSVFLSDSTLSVQVKVGGVGIAGATVVAWKAGDEYRIGTTNASGNVVLPFRPDSLGPITLTVTAYDARPYQGQIGVSGALLQPVLADRGPTIDDDASGGTAGNADGLVDAGETIDVRIQVKNNGTQQATGVGGTLSTTEPLVTIPVAAVTYPSINPGATSNVSSSYRIVIPSSIADQREIRFNLRLADGAGRTWNESISLVAHAKMLRHFSHTIADAGGNANGVADPGELVQYIVTLRNLGSGRTGNVTAKLRNHDGLATVGDSTATFGTFLAGQEKTGDAFAFTASSTAAKLELRVSDGATLVFSQLLDIVRPASPIELSGTGSATSITLTWARSLEPDLLGYHLFRSSALGGPFSRLTAIPTERTAYYIDDGLATLTRYYYRVSSVDSSGNESAQSPVVPVSTNPPTHPYFPMPIPTASASSVALEHIWPGYPISIVSGTGRGQDASGDVLYAWNPDGTAPVDADGSIATSGDFTRRGSTYLASPAVGDLDGDGEVEIVAVSWDSLMAFAFQRDGSVRAGWPVQMTEKVWSSPALGDLDGDGKLEIAFGGNGINIHAFKHNGTEVRDGDNNPSTNGVWRRVNSGFNFCTPSYADFDNDGKLDLVFASSNCSLYVTRWNGSDVPGWPIFRGGAGAHVYASLAVGHLDGISDTQFDVVVPISRDNGNDSLLVYRANGQLRPGWPVAVQIGGGALHPSPALADMNNDGFLDIVVTGSDGLLYVFDRNGLPILPLHGTRWSTITRTLTTYATEASPVVADINGDGMNDIVIGDELGYVTAISGDGTVLPGFPILTGAEVKSTAGLCDCDGDGKTEIVLAGMDQKVHMWDYDFPFSPNGVPPWPQFHHDSRRTGSSKSLPFTAVEEEPAPVPQPIRALELSAPSPNPAPFETRFAWAIPTTRIGATLELSVFDLSGRRVKTLESGAAKAGRHSVVWNLRNDEGRRVDSGVYFVRMRLGDETRSHRIAVLR